MPRRIPVLKFSQNEIRRFRMQLSDSIRPVIEAQDRVNAISKAMLPHMTPEGYDRKYGPATLPEQLREAYAEIARLRRS